MHHSGRTHARRCSLLCAPSLRSLLQPHVGVIAGAGGHSSVFTGTTLRTCARATPHSSPSTLAARMDRTAATVSMLAAHASSAVSLASLPSLHLHSPAAAFFYYFILFPSRHQCLSQRFNRSESRSTITCRGLKSKAHETALQAVTTTSAATSQILFARVTPSLPLGFILKVKGWCITCCSTLPNCT